MVAVPVVQRVTPSQVAVEAVAATPQFFAVLHIWSRLAAAAAVVDPVKRVVVALVAAVEAQLVKTVQRVEAAAVVEVPVGQLEVRLEVEVMRAESDRPIQAEMEEIARVPMRIRVAVAEVLAKPAAVAVVLRRLKMVQAAVVVDPH